MHNKLENIKVINSDILKSLSSEANIKVTKIDNNVVLYNFTEKEPSEKIYYDNGIIETSSRNISILAVTQIDKENSGTLTNSDIVLKASMFYTERTDGYLTIVKLNKSEGTVINRMEPFGRNMIFEVRSAGERMDANFNSYAYGSEGWYTGTAYYPPIGTTYEYKPTFNYYYLTSNGGIALNLSYEISHNGTSFYSYTIPLNVGSFPF